ncbi:MFS transporter [Ornithinibacillus halophilus]|uniref:Predicted arabinose efflux permease, MFS family n=1 Tax=Ornithinibacillus halophilus TaxID=930117 RepID=A0A1M5MHD9_9BACI|nr:MFS transporter [Ornithinibacillus halophilus]SHG76656.1 Predicted arabinose efflux permease, MFS family [Ornithinibacillus halophilus]
MVSTKMRFWILISLVTISGFSQGMILPLLAIILEQNGVPSSVNGMHATGLYIGVLLASPFMEKPMQKFGFKPIIIVGGVLVFVSLALFPVWDALWFWFILRVTIGIGDNMLHFGTQTWITTTVIKETRGRSIALYGMFFGLGFALGPLMTRLLAIHEALPFLVSAVLSMLVWSLMLLVRNQWPQSDNTTTTMSTNSSFKRFIKTGKIAWVALLAPMAYGVLEATLHGIFPIYGLRIGHDVGTLSLIIPCFAAGSLISQLPLGMLSDRIGRRKVLLLVLSGGVVCFLLAAYLETSVVALFILFAFAGMFVGSLFSLGISYMTDLLPTDLLPAGNIMCGVAFSLGSIGGPYIGGLFLQWFPGVSFFYILVFLLLLITVAIIFKQEQKAVAQA